MSRRNTPHDDIVPHTEFVRNDVFSPDTAAEFLAEISVHAAGRRASTSGGRKPRFDSTNASDWIGTIGYQIPFDGDLQSGRLGRVDTHSVGCFVSFGPLQERFELLTEFCACLGQVVLDARRNLIVLLSGEVAGLNEFVESCRER